MNDAERWRIVAEWFDEAARTGDFSEWRVKSGLCAAYNYALLGWDDYMYDRLPHCLLQGIIPRIDFVVSHDYRTREGAGWRACLALLLAHDAEDTGGNHAEDA